MNVYDFDNTIYDGESMVDFLLFCLSKNKKYSYCLPKLMYPALLYKLNRLSIEEITKIASSMSHLIVKNKDQAEELIVEFWKKYSYKLKKDFLSKIKEEDIIITASPYQLINGIKDKLKTSNIIASRLDLETGKLEFLCYKDNKLIALKKQYPSVQIDKFYTDSLSDISLINSAKEAYLVKKRKLVPI